MKEMIETSGRPLPEETVTASEEDTSQDSSNGEDTHSEDKKKRKPIKITDTDTFLFIRFFTRKKTLSASQVSRRDKLLARDYNQVITVSYPECDPIKLLEIWENKGLDEAVAAWEKASRTIRASNINMKKKKIRNGISPESIEAIKNEIKSGGGETVDLDLDWDDIPEDLENLEEIEDIPQDFDNLSKMSDPDD